MHVSLKKIVLTLLLTTNSIAYSQTNWEVLTNAPAVNGRFDDVMFISPETGWLIHSQGRVYKTTDGGQSWSLIHVASGELFRSIVFADSLHGWIGSLAGPDFLLQTTDGGSNWSAVPNTKNLAITGICGFFAASDSVIYGVGRFDGNPHLIKTKNKGQSWTSTDFSRYASTLVDCFFFNPDTGFVVGGSKTGVFPSTLNAVILQTYDGGLNWIERKVTARSGEWCWKISFANRNTGFVSIETNGFRGRSQHILKTVDGGLNWNELLIGSNFRIQGIGLVTPNLGWVGGRSQTFETTDGGVSWDITSFEWQNVNRFRFFGDTVGYAIGKKVYKFQNTVKPTSVISKTETPDDFRLLQNYPNPFNPTTTIAFQLKKKSTVSLKVFNTIGQTVKTLLNNSTEEAGYHEVQFDGATLLSGIYIYKIESENFTAIQKMLLIK